VTAQDVAQPDARLVADLVRARLDVPTPVAGLVLGSGLGGLARRLEAARAVDYSDLPGFAEPTVPGHAGRLLVGTLGGRPVVALAGRFHVYEGHSAASAAFPVRVLHALGAPVLLLANAAGGIRADLAPGDLMLIRDHVNLSFRNPLIGRVVAGDERFPDMSDPWDAALRALLADCAAHLGIAVKEGVYGGLAGPSYETPAEVRMLGGLGIDAVGMSTVHEVIVARALGMRVAGVSCITNKAAGLGEGPIDHQEVLDMTVRAGERFEQLVMEWVGRLEGQGSRVKG
jgi:purine-nucleoside phosphorylase